MLLMTGEVVKSCPKGENVAEQKKTGTKRVNTTAGEKRVPVLESTYLDGKPFGQFGDVSAPIDLRPGDELVISAEDGTPVRVARDGKVVWGTKPEQPAPAKALPVDEPEFDDAAVAEAAPKARRKTSARA